MLFHLPTLNESGVVYIFSKFLVLQFWTKHLWTFSRFSKISLHHEWNESRIISPKICWLPRELPNDLRLRILRNYQISRKLLKRETLWFHGEYPAANQKPNLNIFGESSQKISCKTFHRKIYFPLFCKFINNLMSKIVCNDL